MIEPTTANGQKWTQVALRQPDLGRIGVYVWLKPNLSCARLRTWKSRPTSSSQKSYIVTAAGNDDWYAEKDGMIFQAESLIELLGVVSMYEARGPKWAAADQEIDDFLAKYDQ